MLIKIILLNPIRPGPFQSTVRPGGGGCHTPLGKTAPAADMKFFLYTILEIHIFKAPMQSFNTLALLIFKKIPLNHTLILFYISKNKIPLKKLVLIVNKVLLKCILHSGNY